MSLIVGLAISPSLQIRPSSGGAAGPVNTVAPVISTTSTPSDIEGDTYTVTPGTYTGVTGGLTYQWQSAGVDIPGAQGTSYRGAYADIAAAIRVREITGNGGVSTPSNAITIKNGYLARIGIRGTAGGATDITRCTSGVNADTGVINRVPVGGIGSYRFQRDQAGAAFDDDIGGGAQLAGYVTINSSFKTVTVYLVPNLASPGVKVRIALGRSSVGETNVGYSIWDGSPTGGGTKRMEGTIASIPAGNVGCQDGNYYPTATWLSLAPFSDVICTTGAIYVTWNTTTSQVGYLRLVDVAYPQVLIETSGTGNFYVNAATGNSAANDGRSAAAAWQHWPGDIDAPPRVRDFIMTAGAALNLEGGQIHKPGGFGPRKQFFFPKGSGANGNPITVQPRAGSGTPIIEGSEDLAFTTVATGLTGGNPNETSITGHTVAAVNWNQPPVQAGRLFKPATYPAPSAIRAYDDSDPGTDAYFAEGAVTGPGGSAPEWVEGAADSQRAGYKKCTYSGNKILSHYGAVSINGYRASVRLDGNQLDEVDITSHVTGTGVITVEIENGRTLWVSAGGFDFMWQVRYHPFDIHAQDQYANIPARTFPMAWFAASGTRGLCRLNIFSLHPFSDWTFADGITYRNFAGGDSAYIISDNQVLTGGPSRIKFAGTVKGMCDYGRDYAFLFKGNGAGHDIGPLDMSDMFTKGGVAYAITQSSALHDFKIRDAGRTVYFTSGVYPNNSKSNILTNVDWCNCKGIHANGGTMYGDSQLCEINNALGLMHVRPSTNQRDTAGLSTANKIRNFAFTGIAKAIGAPQETSLIVVTVDQGGKDSIIEKGFIGGQRGLHLGPDSSGMTVRRVYLSNLEFSAGVLTGIKFENVVIGGGNAADLAALLSNGADVTSGNVTFTATPYDGTITDEARKAITRTNGQTLPATYADTNIALTTPSNRSWIIPASGTTFALTDIELSEQNIASGSQAGKMITQVFNTKPEAVVTLASGVSGSNNALFGMSLGQIYPIANLPGPPGTTYNLDILETNNSADRTGPNTRITRRVLTMV